MRQWLKSFKNIVSVIFTLIVVFGIGYFIGTVSAKNGGIVWMKNPNTSDLKLPGEVEKMVVTVDEVEAKILEIGELTSCEGEYIVTKGEDFTRHVLDNIPIPGTTNHIELTCSGVVKAGYDLNEITVRVDETSKTIYVSLPEAQINSNQLMWDESMVCEEENNFLNPIEFEQYQTLIAEIKEEGLKQAKDNGLFDTVKENAEKLITNFLGCFVDYQVSFL